MNDYVIFADSSCDLSVGMLKSRGVYSLPLSFRFNNDKEYKNSEMTAEEFYSRMRSGDAAKTSAVNPEDFAREFEKQLRRGKDILYLGFSSALSSTYNSARIAADMLNSSYPQHRILTVDSLSASAGIALLIDNVLKEKHKLPSIADAKEYADALKHKICHLFTVDDLAYLMRGGRVSPTAAFFGNVLGIKPLLVVDEGGRLTNKQKVRGRKNAIYSMAECCSEKIDNNFPLVAYISHADCSADANELKHVLKEKYGINTKLITNVGPVIGAHSGPGTLALFFIGKER